MKFIRYLLILLIFIPFSTCTEEEVLKDVTRVQENNGLMIKPDSTFMVLENADIISCQSVGSTLYEGKTIQTYQLTIEGEELNEIKPGTIIVDKKGMGKVYLVIGLFVDGKSSESKAFQSLDFKVTDISLDFLFNYDGAKIIFSSPENRAKKNSTIDGKINTNLLNDDPEEFKEELAEENGNWDGFSTSTTQDQISLKFSNTLIGLKPTSGSATSVDATIEGFVNMNFGIDFLMEYNPYYLKTNDPSLSSFFKLITTKSPAELFGATAITLGTMKELKAITYTELDYGLNFELSYTQDLGEGSLFKQNIARFVQVYPATVVPVSLVTELNLEIDLKTIGEVKAKYKFEKENDIVLGFDLIRNGFNNNDIKWYLDRKSVEKNQSSLVAKIELTAGIYLVLEMEVYVAGILGPQAKGYGFIEGGLDLWQSTSGDGWKIFMDAGIAGEASMDLSLFHFDKATWSFYKSQKIELKYPLYSSPYGVRVIEGDNQTGYTGQTLPGNIRFQVYDKWDNPLSSELPDVWVYLDGSNNPSFNGTVPQSPVSTTNGIAETEWTLDNTVGTQKLLAYLKSAEGSTLSHYATVQANALENTFVDNRDGHRYKWVQIGNQIWMAENLAYLPNVGPYTNESFSNSVYYVYNYFGINVSEAKLTDNFINYGVLYNWNAASNGCPSGWHLPSDNEWDELTYNLGGEQQAGGKLKESGFTHWNSPNVGATNSSYFTALPGGFRPNGIPTGYQYYFYDLGNLAFFWTSTYEQGHIGPWYRALGNSLSDIMRYEDARENGFSVRCVKD